MESASTGLGLAGRPNTVDGIASAVIRHMVAGAAPADTGQNMHRDSSMDHNSDVAEPALAAEQRIACRWSGKAQTTAVHSRMPGTQHICLGMRLRTTSLRQPVVSALPQFCPLMGSINMLRKECSRAFRRTREMWRSPATVARIRPCEQAEAQTIPSSRVNCEEPTSDV